MRYSLFALLLLSQLLSAATLQWYSVPQSQGKRPAASAPSALSQAVKSQAVKSQAVRHQVSSHQAGEALSCRPQLQGDVELIDEVARHHALDPLLVHAIVAIESADKAEALSKKGAVGLMQVMPATGARFGQRALWEPRANLEAGAAYLSWLMQHFDGRLDLVLAGYNAGEGAVARYGNTIPPYAETQAYVRKVLAHYAGLRGEPGAGASHLIATSDHYSPTQRSFTPGSSAASVGNVGQLWRLFTGGSLRVDHPSRI